jgi:putative PIN family toxin of toxin-antitoxin system
VQRAVLDPGVLVSALITPTGSPAKLLRKAQEADFDLVVSPMLLGELEGVLRREKFRRYVDLDAVARYLEFIRRMATVVPDPEGPPPLRCADPADDYLIVLAYSQKAVLVSGDSDLLGLASEAPIHSPADFLRS